MSGPLYDIDDRSSAQRRYALREVFNGLRWLVRAGAPWRMLPNDLPPWEVVYQQTQRWLKAGVFEALVQDLRVVLRVAGGRRGQPSAAILDSRTLQSSPESGGRSGYDGAKPRRGARCTWPSIRWATSWRCTSLPPMSRIGRGSRR